MAGNYLSLHLSYYLSFYLSAGVPQALITSCCWWTRWTVWPGTIYPSISIYLSAGVTQAFVVDGRDGRQLSFYLSFRLFTFLSIYLYLSIYLSVGVSQPGVVDGRGGRDGRELSIFLSINMQVSHNRVLLMDEVDGMAGNYLSFYLSICRCLTTGCCWWTRWTGWPATIYLSIYLSIYPHVSHNRVLLMEGNKYLTKFNRKKNIHKRNVDMRCNK